MKNGQRKKRKNAAMALLLLTSLIMALIWVSMDGDAEKAASSLRREQKKLTDIRALIEDNRHLIDVTSAKPLETDAVGGRPAISIIKDLAVHAGISEKLIRVIPEENRKRHEVTAKVVLKGVKLRDIVNFLVRLRGTYPSVFDKEARLRLTGKGRDRWDAGLALTYGQ